MMDKPTREDIARHYSASMDSVNLINRLKAKADKTAVDTNTITRNVEHLKLMVAKDFWTTENMTPLTEAIG